MSWPEGRIELPAVVVGTNELDGVEANVPMGLAIGGLWEVMLIGGLGIEFTKLVATLLVGDVGGIPLDEDAGNPSRAAMICARSWYSLCLDLSSCSLTLIIMWSISLKKANFISNLCNCNRWTHQKDQIYTSNNR